MKIIEKINNSLSSPLVKGTPVSIREAIKNAKQMINNSSGIHVDGLGCDLVALYEVFLFAEKNNTSIDHADNKNIVNFNNCLQISGTNLVSQGEIRNRSDLILVIGENEENEDLNFLDLKNNEKKIKDKIYFVVEKKTKKTKFNYLNLGSDKIDQALDKVYNIINTFHLKFEDSKKHNFSELLQMMQKSNYGTIIFNSVNHSNLGIHRVIEIVKLLNSLNKKFAIYHLGGKNNISGAIQTSLWKTGFPLRVKFTDEGPIYNSLEYNGEFLSDKKELQIYISCFDKKPRVNLFKKNIFIGNPFFNLKSKVDIFIPTSVPGLDQKGLIVRGDGVCIEKLDKKKESKYKSVKEIFNLLN